MILLEFVPPSANAECVLTLWYVNIIKGNGNDTCNFINIWKQVRDLVDVFYRLGILYSGKGVSDGNFIDNLYM